MTTYLVYVVIYNCIVKELLIKGDIDISQNPIQIWYSLLWKLRAPFCIYHIHDLFMGRYREILTGEVQQSYP